jgi:hypothetical protein
MVVDMFHVSQVEGHDAKKRFRSGCLGASGCDDSAVYQKCWKLTEAQEKQRVLVLGDAENFTNDEERMPTLPSLIRHFLVGRSIVPARKRGKQLLPVGRTTLLLRHMEETYSRISVGSSTSSYPSRRQVGRRDESHLKSFPLQQLDLNETFANYTCISAIFDKEPPLPLKRNTTESPFKTLAWPDSTRREEDDSTSADASHEPSNSRVGHATLVAVPSIRDDVSIEVSTYLALPTMEVGGRLYASNSDLKTAGVNERPTFPFKSNATETLFETVAKPGCTSMLEDSRTTFDLLSDETLAALQVEEPSNTKSVDAIEVTVSSFRAATTGSEVSTCLDLPAKEIHVRQHASNPYLTKSRPCLSVGRPESNTLAKDSCVETIPPRFAWNMVDCPPAVPESDVLNDVAVEVAYDKFYLPPQDDSSSEDEYNGDGSDEPGSFGVSRSAPLESTRHSFFEKERVHLPLKDSSSAEEDTNYKAIPRLAGAGELDSSQESVQHLRKKHFFLPSQDSSSSEDEAVMESNGHDRSRLSVAPVAGEDSSQESVQLISKKKRVFILSTQDSSRSETETVEANREDDVSILLLGSAVNHASLSEGLPPCKKKRRALSLRVRHFFDEEAEVDSEEDTDCEIEELRALEEEEMEDGGFINDSSQLGCSSSPVDGVRDGVHRALDIQRAHAALFATPILNRRMKKGNDSMDSWQQHAPDSATGLGNMNFIRSVIEHHQQGGRAEDIEKRFHELEEGGGSLTPEVLSS